MTQERWIQFFTASVPSPRGDHLDEYRYDLVRSAFIDAIRLDLLPESLIAVSPGYIHQFDVDRILDDNMPIYVRQNSGQNSLKRAVALLYPRIMARGAGISLLGALKCGETLQIRGDQHEDESHVWIEPGPCPVKLLPTSNLAPASLEADWQVFDAHAVSKEMSHVTVDRVQETHSKDDRLSRLLGENASTYRRALSVAMHEINVFIFVRPSVYKGASADSTDRDQFARVDGGVVFGLSKPPTPQESEALRIISSRLVAGSALTASMAAHVSDQTIKTHIHGLRNDVDNSQNIQEPGELRGLLNLISARLQYRVGSPTKEEIGWNKEIGAALAYKAGSKLTCTVPAGTYISPALLVLMYELLANVGKYSKGESRLEYESGTHTWTIAWESNADKYSKFIDKFKKPENAHGLWIVARCTLDLAREHWIVSDPAFHVNEARVDITRIVRRDDR